jgi:FlaG/FlaF family flagellin (archaellin)
MKMNWLSRRSGLSPSIGYYIMVALVVGRLAGIGVTFIFAKTQMEKRAADIPKQHYNWGCVHLLR